MSRFPAEREVFGLSADESGLHGRLHPAPVADTLVYLPGLHGDWTLLGPFREALQGRLRLVEFTYARREDWDLRDHAAAVLDELARLGVSAGWLLAESFSSQTAWAIARLLGEPDPIAGEAPSSAGEVRRVGRGFVPCGLILAGGFVRHPVPWGVRLAERSSRAVPGWLLERLCASYGRWARRRCEAVGASSGEIDLFVARRINQQDRQAMTSRYRLIRDDDLRPVARTVRCPVFCLTGGLDPIVPWPPVVRWLRLNCPGYRGRRVLWRASHNVLLDAPRESADQIVAWVQEPK